METTLAQKMFKTNKENTYIVVWLTLSKEGTYHIAESVFSSAAKTSNYGRKSSVYATSPKDAYGKFAKVAKQRAERFAKRIGLDTIEKYTDYKSEIVEF